MLSVEIINSKMEYAWPIPGDETIKVYCHMRLLDLYEESRLSRLKKIIRPSQQRQDQQSKQAQQEAMKQAMYDMLRRNGAGTSTSNTSNNTWIFT